MQPVEECTSSSGGATLAPRAASVYWQSGHALVITFAVVAASCFQLSDDQT